jgi:hypothetical protein
MISPAAPIASQFTLLMTHNTQLSGQLRSSWSERL